ncbi:MAG TPA: LPS export ABC transporter periplasmic protein LptC [Candidatus Eisenbacteria bacterium]|nr:LPS export ABC transporter periplasmic protein LptC [Candidatus Eisenbacteria bacterium]
MTVRSARLLLAGALAVGLPTLLLSSAGCHRRTAPVASSDELRIPDQEARDFTLTESAAGKKNWTLRADYAAMFNKERKVDAKSVTIDFFDQEGAHYSTLTADQGEIDQTTNDLEARGDVRVTTKNGIAMETDSLRFFNRTGKIVSDGFVRVTRRGDVLTGYGFESDATLEHFKLRREVRAEVRNADGASAIDP